MAREATPVVLLTGYDAKRCARRVHNERDPTIDLGEVFGEGSASGRARSLGNHCHRCVGAFDDRRCDGAGDQSAE